MAVGTKLRCLLTKAAYDAAEKEVKDAQEMLDKVEKRWEVIDIDNEAIDISVQNEGNSKKRKVSLSPQSIGASSNRNDSITSAAASSSSQTTSNDTIISATLLTSNGISKMYHMSGSVDEPSFMPILQVIELRKINNRIGDSAADRYKVILSDGQHFFSGVSSQIGLGLGCGVVSQYCILRITNFIVHTSGSGAKMLILFGAEHVGFGGSSTSSRIGAPCEYARTLTSTNSQNRLQTGASSTSLSNNVNQIENSRAEEAPQQITVTGCGISQANGVYKQDALSIMGKSRYVKDGRWKGKNDRFVIRRDYFGDSWSFYAHADRIYVVSSTDISLPPKTGWKPDTNTGVVGSALTLNY